MSSSLERRNKQRRCDWWGQQIRPFSMRILCEDNECERQQLLQTFTISRPQTESSVSENCVSIGLWTKIREQCRIVYMGLGMGKQRQQKPPAARNRSVCGIVNRMKSETHKEIPMPSQRSLSTFSNAIYGWRNSGTVTLFTINHLHRSTATVPESAIELLLVG